MNGKRLGKQIERGILPLIENRTLTSLSLMTDLKNKIYNLCPQSSGTDFIPKLR
jgi:hypothetical protein